MGGKIRCIQRTCCTGLLLPSASRALRRAVEQHKPKILFLTSPNNPDGSMMPDEEVRDPDPESSPIHTSCTL